MVKKKYAFYAQTTSGYVIKGIFEILLECLTNEVPLIIRESGLEARSVDKKNRQLVLLSLPMEKFDRQYVCKRERSIAIHLKTFCKFVKQVKKKDSLTLFLEEEDSKELGIQIISLNSNTDGNDGKEISRMRIHDVIPANFVIPDGYYFPKSMKSVSYQKMCKKMTAFERPTVHISMQKHNYISFTGSTDLINTRIECGEYDEDDESPLYEADFSRDSLNQFVKISTLSGTIQISAPKDPRFPLKIEAQTALGTFVAYVKTESQIEAEKNLSTDKVVHRPRDDARSETAENTPKESKPSRESKVAKEAKPPKEPKVQKESKVAKETKPPKVAKEPKVPTKETKTVESHVQAKPVKRSELVKATSVAKVPRKSSNGK